MCQHLGYVKNKVLGKATGQHFDLPEHNKNDMKFPIIKNRRSSDPLCGREDEKLQLLYLIVSMEVSIGSHENWLYHCLPDVYIS